MILNYSFSSLYSLSFNSKSFLLYYFIIFTQIHHLIYLNYYEVHERDHLFILFMALL